MKLSTGKNVYSNGDIFGVTKTGFLTEGYDAYIFDHEDEADTPLTAAEKCEIADLMIERWQSYKKAWTR